jgi:putative transposase
MPWKETCAMDQKNLLIDDFMTGNYSKTELSEMYGVSRKTVHKWVKRFSQGGRPGLEERSRAPGTHPNETSREIKSQIIDTKLEHKTWGPKKVVARLQTIHPQQAWPAPSTVGLILKKEGLVDPRRFKRHVPPYTEPFKDCLNPNDVWCIDYKGQFRTQDGRLCYPFTVTDSFSRYLLCCQGLFHPNMEDTWFWLERTFGEYGLPKVIKSDNGEPFASVGLGGLSAFSIKLIKLHIRVERIEPGHPEQNGRHERMHRTLKAETVNPPKANMQEQQKVFDDFRWTYVNIRPNEGVGQQTPASLYLPSNRILPKRLDPVEYDNRYTVRQVRHNGQIKWKGHFIYISQALAKEPIGLMQISEEEWEVRFSFHLLGILNERIVKVLPVTKKDRKCNLCARSKV